MAKSSVTVTPDAVALAPIHGRSVSVIRVISENFSQLPLNIYKREPNGDTNIAHDFHVQKLLKRPNRYMTPTEFKRNQILSIFIGKML
jgi:phage portal protein BeeE